MTEKEFHRLVEAHYDRLFRAARFMCGSDQGAEDLVQETFLAAADARDRFEGRSSDYTWLYGILLNKFRRWLRRKSSSFISLQRLGPADRDGATQFEADVPGPVDRALREERIQQVRNAIDELSADHRAVITLRYLEGLSYEEIARTVDCPLGTVKSRIHYALQKIGDYLRDL
ncbi:MAG: RNA polymerase sigma factor [Candidatus Brocadiaceae bacterium]